MKKKNTGISVKNTAKTRGLKPWKPGQSGNPSGRPKATLDFKQKILDFFEQKHPSAQELSRKMGHDVRTRLDVILLRLEKDDPKVLLYYGFGKPVETMQHQGPGGGPVQHQHDLKKLSVEQLVNLQQLIDAAKVTA